MAVRKCQARFWPFCMNKHRSRLNLAVFNQLFSEDQRGSFSPYVGLFSFSVNVALLPLIVNNTVSPPYRRKITK